MTDRLERLGAERRQLLLALREVEEELRDELRARFLCGEPKVVLAAAAGVSRPTLDEWLKEER